jgi:GMP synthase (glutamine-hydrolysing)
LKRILILQAGSPEPALRTRIGEYTEHFLRVLSALAELTVVRPDAEPLPPAEGFAGMLMTGSPRSVTAPEPWMDAAGRYLLDAAQQIPVLGVCFGHQLLGRVLGGRVERNPRGREVGTVPVTLTAAGRADPLFRGIEERPSFQQTHEDHVPTLPPGCVLLAENEQTPIQAFAHGERIRAVQFHPEMGAREMAALVEVRRELLDRTVAGGAAGVAASVRETPAGTVLLRNWAAGLADR